MKRAAKKIINHATRGRDFILDLLFPINCLNCGEAGNYLCKNCERKLQYSPGLYCPHCGLPAKFGEFCPSCSHGFYLNGIWTAGDYENEIIRLLIKNLKYKFIKDIANILGNYTALFLRGFIGKLDRKEEIPRVFLEFNKSLIIPVPLHKKRLNWRGFNQALAIAEVIALILGLQIDSKNLVRVKNTKPQAKFGGQQRKENIKNSFLWQGNDLKNKNIILFDDVSTTGATMNECAKVLKKAGAGEIWGLAAAKG